jgi:lactoylglutathione lyase
MNLLHVGINVSDMKKSEDFYVNVIGCKKTGRIENEALEISFLDFNNSAFELIYKKDSSDKPVNNGSIHFAFSSDDVDAEFARVKALGGKMDSETPVDFEGGKLFFFYGPDGEKIEYCKNVNIIPV